MVTTTSRLLAVALALAARCTVHDATVCAIRSDMMLIN